MSRYDTNERGTSPVLSQIMNEFAKMPRDAFDESRTKDLDVPMFGIIPVECFQMFPNSEGYLRYDVQAILKNPTISRMFSNCKIELRTYKCKNSDLWEGWNNFVTRGRSGKVTKSIPYLIPQKDVNNRTITSNFPYNPLHYLNICPADFYCNDLSFDNNHGFHNLSEVGIQPTDLLKTANYGIKPFSVFHKGISALPLVMYAKVAKEFQNPNLLQDNPNWYPENENHDLILSYECTKASNATYGKEEYFFSETHEDITYDEEQPTNDSKSMPWLNVLYFKQRRGDYFNTASPFPDLLRGDVPTLDLLNASVDASAALASPVQHFISMLGITADGKLGIPDFKFVSGDNDESKPLFKPDGDLWTLFARSADDMQTAQLITTNELQNLLKETFKKFGVANIKFSMNEWRRLATMTVFRERMARSDGSYNQMIMAQFRHNPNWHEHGVVYCGGSTQPVVFSEVVQQSESGTTPLGTTAGRAFSNSTSREIYVKSDDYSIFMTVLCITPNTVYSQGIDRMWSELNQAEQYFPILNNLEPQAILNKELFISGDNDIDNDVFAYQERFAHFKSRQDQVSGLMALPISKVGKIGTYLFNRLFDDTPNFNWDFVEGQFTDNEDRAFSSLNQAPFILHISSNFKYIAPMPAISQASDMGLSY